jgi:hypothetical protein
MYSQNDNVNTTEQYQTTDIGSATALVSVGHSLASLDKTNPRRALFVFDNSTDLQARLKDYWSGTLSVDAKTYFENHKWLKSRIYNG